MEWLQETLDVLLNCVALLVEDIDLGVTRQEGRVTLRVIARSPELSFKMMGQRWAETRIWLKACSYNHCYSRLVV